MLPIALQKIQQDLQGQGEEDTPDKLRRLEEASQKVWRDLSKRKVGELNGSLDEFELSCDELYTLADIRIRENSQVLEDLTREIQGRVNQ